jgi:tetratricopeptide (TPR) repeat protein
MVRTALRVLSAMPHLMTLEIEANMEIRGLARFRKCVSVVIAATMLCAPAYADEISDVSALLEGGQYAVALAKTDEYLSSRPNDSQMRFLKGLALTGMGRRDEAMSQFTNLTSDFPDMPEPYNNLAVLYAESGQYDKARAALERAVNVNSTYALAHENLANMYVQLAAQSYASALKLAPDNVNVRAKHALLLSAINHRGERPATDGTSAGNAKVEVLNAIQEWAKAWSARDIAAYIDFYSQDFLTPHNRPRAKWEGERRARLKEASYIKVSIQDPEISIDGMKATATFIQHYRSDRSSSLDRKTITWEKRGEKWKIVREDSRKLARRS